MFQLLVIAPVLLRVPEEENWSVSVFLSAVEETPDGHQPEDTETERRLQSKHRWEQQMYSLFMITQLLELVVALLR